MQTATTMKRFVFNHTGAMAVAFSILIGGAIGITALTLTSDDPASGTVESERTMPKAYVHIGQGEGLIDPGNTRVAAKPPIKAFVWDGQGEGLIDGSNLRVEAAASSRSFVSDGQVAGLIDGADRATVLAYLGLGQGEGLVGPGGSTDRNLIEPQTNLKAYPSVGQGEGLVDPTNRRAAPDVLKTYSSPDD
jgi:hypothetical protein